MKSEAVHASDPRHPQTPGQVPESLASLVKRLGTPPDDLVDQLTGQFESICSQLREAQPSRFARIELDLWCVDRSGKLVPHASEEVFLDQVGEPADRRTPQEQAKQFRALLRRPRAASGIRRSLNHNPLVDFDTADNFDIAEEDRSADEQARRDKIAALFTASLVDRFGTDAIRLEEAPKSHTKTAKMRTRRADRRFDWNLVLGVGTLVVIAAMIFVGYSITHQRQERIATAIRDTSTTRSSGPANVAPSPKPVPAVPTVKQSEEPEVRPIESSPASAFSDRRSKRESIDSPLETLDSLTSGEEKFDVAIDPGSSLAVNLPSGVTIGSKSSKSADRPKKNAMVRPARGPDTQAAPKEGSLEEVLAGDDDDSVPETPQDVRPTTTQFVELPRPSEIGRVEMLPIATENIQAIEFPVKMPLELSQADGEFALTNVKKQSTIARLRPSEEQTSFVWTADAKGDPLSAGVMHGRLRGVDESLVYLRPAIETDPLRLTLGPENARPTWNLGASVPTRLSRLIMDLDVPDGIEYAWSEKLPGDNPRRGRAVAILTPEDGETVAVAVLFQIRTDRKLECRMRYAARLDPSLPWQSFDITGMNRMSLLLARQRQSLRTQISTFDSAYDNSDAIGRKLQERRRAQLVKQQEQLDVTIERVAMLDSLSAKIQASVDLNLELSVQWPGGKQTLLRTVSPKAAEADAE